MYQVSRRCLNPRTPGEEAKLIVERLEDKLEGRLVTLRSGRRRCLINLDKTESFHHIDLPFFFKIMLSAPEAPVRYFFAVSFFGSLRAWSV
jgi:hypothetical protein